MKAFVFLLLFSAQLTHAKVIETQTMKEILKYIGNPEETLIVTDLDYQWTVLQKTGQIVTDVEAQTNLSWKDDQNMKIAYKILTQSEYEIYHNQHYFLGSALDLKDGFIHLSTESQLERTLNKYYSKEDHVYILKIDIDLVSENILWEPASNGDLFPHLYNKAIDEGIVISVEKRTMN